MKKVLRFTWQSLCISLCLLSIASAQITQVRESNIIRQGENTVPTNNWVLYTRAGTPASSGQFINGPGVTPLGCGSLQLSTQSGSEKVFFFNFDHVNKNLSNIAAISYATYRSQQSVSTPDAVASLNVQIDYNGGNPGGFSTLVFEPIYTFPGGILDNTWQTWDAKAGLWWSTQTINGQPAGAAVADMRTWAQIVANNPAAVILGGVGINQGSGNSGITTAVDAFTFDATTYNFEQQQNNVLNVNTGRTYCTIQAAINDATTAAGHTIQAAAGTYVEDVLVNKSVTLQGAGIGSSIISGPFGGDGATVRIAASGVTIQGFTITREGNNLVDWANPTLNSAGIAIQGAFTNATIRNNKIEGNRTGIDINNSSGHSILANDISNNRTGLIFRNQTDNITVKNNFITGNWTVGILFLDGSGGTNSPVQSAAGSQFTENNISGNWYGQVVDRQIGGSLPAPGSNLKTFTCNWFGSTTPTVSISNSAEPGYAAQIPVIYGGTAIPPAPQPDIAGPASANIVYLPMLANGIDGNAAIGFQPASACATPVPYISFTATTTNGSTGSTATGTPSTVTLHFVKGASFSFSGFSTSPGANVGVLEELISGSGNVTYNNSLIPIPRAQTDITPSGAGLFFTGPYGPYGLTSGIMGTFTQKYTPYYDVNTDNNYDVGVDILGTPVYLVYNVHDPACDNNPKSQKVYVCHEGKTICISINALQTHLDHGDKLGDCSWYGTPTVRPISSELTMMNVKQALVAAYPSPTSDEVNVQLPSLKSGRADITITNAKGAVVEKKTVNVVGNGQLQRFSLRKNGAGMYFIRIVTDEGIQTLKVLVQR